ncbi:MAG: ABC transporter ATP-binding protein [Fimbriimonadaceae bacterium]|nr:ABC transporter ATP-binding protein [Fimbriimonadaceae bacterium]
MAEQPAVVPPVVAARDVSKVWDAGTPAARPALRDVNFRVDNLPERGEFITIVGPSGCGKSTLLCLLAGFETHLPLTTGELLVNGQPVSGPGLDRGMIFQKYSSFPHLTVWQNIAFGLNLHRARLKLSSRDVRELAYQWAAKVHLTGSELLYPSELSGGMQQRVAIARTLALKPRIILMDEPFSALDEPTRLAMQDLLVELWREVEATVFMVTHSLEEAIYLGDRLWIFSAAPGTIARQLNDIPLPLEPAAVQQSRPEFEAVAREVGELFRTLTRAPGRADG